MLRYVDLVQNPQRVLALTRYPVDEFLCNVAIVWSRLSARDSRIRSRAIRPSKTDLAADPVHAILHLPKLQPQYDRI